MLHSVLCSLNDKTYSTTYKAQQLITAAPYSQTLEPKRRIQT
jgi:hypothetical protein